MLSWCRLFSIFKKTRDLKWIMQQGNCQCVWASFEPCNTSVRTAECAVRRRPTCVTSVTERNGNKIKTESRSSPGALKFKGTENMQKRSQIKQYLTCQRRFKIWTQKWTFPKQHFLAQIFTTSQTDSFQPENGLSSNRPRELLGLEHFVCAILEHKLGILNGRGSEAIQREPG